MLSMTKTNDKVEKILFVAAVIAIFSLILNITIELLLMFPLKYSLPLTHNLFSDFAEVMAYCFNPKRYEAGIIYPPIAFLPYLPFALICKNHALSWINGEISLEVYSNQTTTIVAFVLYFALSTALTLFLVAKISKFHGKKLACLLVCVLCFGPYFYAFCRGNIIINCLTLLLVFFWLYKSEKRWQREIANLCMALTIALKIYPIFLLVFFIKDRKFLDLLKTLIYSLVLLFLPFLFIKGGFYNIPIMWNNCFGFKDSPGRVSAYNNISLNSLLSSFNELLTKIFSTDTSAFTSILTKLVKYGMVVGTIVLFACSKKSKLYMQTILLSIFCYILFQNVSYGYTMIYLIIPILIYLMNFEIFSKFNKWFYGICFSIIAFPLFYVNLFFLPQAIVLFVLMIKCFVDLFVDDIKIHKQTKLLKEQKVTENKKVEQV